MEQSDCPRCGWASHVPDAFCAGVTEPQPSSAEPIETAQPGVNGYQQAEFNWQPAADEPADKPTQEPVEPVQDRGLHQVFADAMEDPGKLIILALGVQGRKLIGMLESLKYPIVHAFMVPSSFENRQDQVAILDLATTNLVELQALIDVFLDTYAPPQRLDDPWVPGIVVMHEAKNPHPAATHRLCAEQDVRALLKWAATGTYTPLTVADTVIDSLRLRGIDLTTSWRDVNVA